MSTKIAWTDETWNPITGCTKVSLGCRNCYAERMARRLAGRYGYPEAPNHFDVTLHPGRLEQPLRWYKPRRIFVCSMGDLFHEDVHEEWLWRIFKIMAAADRHIYQVLTKRPHRMLEFCQSQWYQDLCHTYGLNNVWLGVSVEKPDYLWRIEELLKIPAAVRFVSLEPMLAPMDIEWTLQGWHEESSQYPDQYGRGPYPIRVQNSALSWVICGAESGPDRRPFDPAWALDVYEQCRRAGVPFFGKQASGPRPGVPLLLGGREVKEWPL